jgi:glutamate/tyrosine decarboxylase-like PLP-dependent enzyme
MYFPVLIRFLPALPLITDSTNNAMKTTMIRLPEKGQAANSLIDEMKEIKEKDAAWRNGHLFGYIYHPGEEEARVIEEAYRMFFYENALNPSLSTP